MTVSLRKITEADAPLLVKWRNENSEFFPPQDDWTVDSHLEWYYGKYTTDPCDNMFMVMLGDDLAGWMPIGCLSMTIRNGCGELERMILGDKSVARGGYMRTAFRMLMDAYDLDYYWLRIYEWNKVTIAFHERNGFTVAGKSYDGEYLIMELEGNRPW